MKTGHARFISHTHHIQIITLIGDKLLFGDAAHGLNLIAQSCRLFEAQTNARLFHAFNQLIENLIVFTG